MLKESADETEMIKQIKEVILRMKIGVKKLQVTATVLNVQTLIKGDCND